MSEYEFSAARDKLGFGSGFYFSHSRSRWHGCGFWIVANPDAVPARVRERCKVERVSPREVADVAASAIDPVLAGRALRLRSFGDAVQERGQWVRPLRLDGHLLHLSRLAVAVNAYYIDWVQRHVPKGGVWWLTLAGDRLVNMNGKRANAVVMPVCLAASSPILTGRGAVA